MKKRRIQVFEHERLLVGPSGLREEEWNTLQRLVTSSPCPYFRLIYKGVQFNQFVGVLQVGSLTIEILPKAGRESNKEIWQKVLLDMLWESRLTDVRDEAITNQSITNRPLLDVFLASYIKEIEKLVHEGIIKRYRVVSNNQNALRGQLQFAENIRQNLVHEERFFVRHPVYDYAHVFHQILVKALSFIPTLTTSSDLISRSLRLESLFPDQAKIVVNEITFQRLRYDRKTERYRRAVELAKLLLLSLRPNFGHGNNHILTLLFDMNRLWEAFLYQRLLRSSLKNNYTIHYQPHTTFWMKKRICADIYLKNKEPHSLLPNIIIDAKWKTPKTANPDDADLKQMYVYNHHFKASKSILVYPRTASELEGNKSSFKLNYLDTEHTCQTFFLPVLKGDKLNPDIVSEIIKQTE